jgi:hypothetical protein
MEDQTVEVFAKRLREILGLARSPSPKAEGATNNQRVTDKLTW